MMEIGAALEWAAAGNIAVHNTGMPFRQWARTAHLFAVDEEALRVAAKSVGCDLKWIQPKRPSNIGPLAGRYLTHFDLFGSRLTRALKRCPTVPSDWS